MSTRYRSEKTKANNEKLGDLGVEVAADQYGADIFPDRFDIRGDMMIRETNEIAEVKTEMRFHQMDVFSIPLDNRINFEKCMNVDRLIFVEVPLYDNIVRMWESLKHLRREGTTYSKASGERMWGWYIDKMLLVRAKEHKELADKLREYSESKLLIKV